MQKARLGMRCVQAGARVNLGPGRLLGMRRLVLYAACAGSETLRISNMFLDTRCA